LNGLLKIGQRETEKEEGRQKEKERRKEKRKEINIENFRCSVTLQCTYGLQLDFLTRDLQHKNMEYVL
jgi:hypothetical protein